MKQKGRRHPPHFFLLSTVNPSSRVHPNEGTPLNPFEGEIPHQKYFLATLVHQKPILCSMPFHNNDNYPSSTCNLANWQHMVVSQRDPTHQNTLSLIPDRPISQYRKWISYRGVCVGLHQFSLHMNRSRTWPHPLIDLNLHGGGMTRTDTPSASERAYQDFPRTRRITVRASGEWTAARHQIGYPLANRISSTPLAQPMHFLRALDWAVIHDKYLESVSLKLAFFSSSLRVLDVIVRWFPTSFSQWKYSCAKRPVDLYLLSCSGQWKRKGKFKVQ